MIFIQNDWWSVESNKAYDEKTKCLIDHYANYTADGLEINSKLTLGENMADVGGLKMAMAAWEESPISTREKPLPGLEDFTTKKLFYIQFAQGYCENVSKEYLRWQIRNDPHAPVEVRVTGTVSLLHDFAETFACKRGTRMNPYKQCLIRD